MPGEAILSGKFGFIQAVSWFMNLIDPPAAADDAAANLEDIDGKSVHSNLDWVNFSQPGCRKPMNAAHCFLRWRIVFWVPILSVSVVSLFFTDRNNKRTVAAVLLNRQMGPHIPSGV